MATVKPCIPCEELLTHLNLFTGKSLDPPTIQKIEQIILKWSQQEALQDPHHQYLASQLQNHLQFFQTLHSPAAFPEKLVSTLIRLVIKNVKSKPLAAGGFGTTDLLFAGSKTYVRKKPLPSTYGKPCSEIFQHELKMLFSLPFERPGIISILAMRFSDKNPDCYITEYYNKGNLEQVIQRRYYETFDPQIKILSDIAQGLKFLHHHGTIHRDLKERNIFVKEGPIAVIGDFGCAVHYEPGKPSAEIRIAGTCDYYPPETVLSYSNKEQPTPSRDVWAYGCVVSVVISNCSTPFIPRFMHQHQMKTHFQLFQDKETPSRLPAYVTRLTTLRRLLSESHPGLAAVEAIAQRSLSFKPENRPSMDTICEQFAKMSTSAET